MASDLMIKAIVDTFGDVMILQYAGKNILCLPNARADDSATIESYSNYRYLLLFKNDSSLVPVCFGKANLLGIDLDSAEDGYIESIRSSYCAGNYIDSDIYFDMIFDSEDAFVEHALLEAGLNTVEVYKWLYNTSNHLLLYKNVIKDYTDMQWKDAHVAEPLLSILRTL